MENPAVYRWMGITVRETTVELVWISVVLMTAFSFPTLWLGILVGLGILSIIPGRRMCRLVRRKLARYRRTSG